MHDWDVVVTVREHGYQRMCRVLRQFGEIARTEFFNVLTLRVKDIPAFLEGLRTALDTDPSLRQALGRVVPVTASFVFRTPEEFEARAEEAVLPWVPVLAGKRFHVRMHRRGFKGRLSTQDEERFLDGLLLARLEAAGRSGQISFDDPDAIVAVETIGPRAGLSLWTREELQRYPFLQAD